MFDIDIASTFNKTTMLVAVKKDLEKFTDHFNLEYYFNNKLSEEYNERYITSLNGQIDNYADNISFHIFRNPLVGYVVLWTHKNKVNQEHLEYFKDPTHWHTLF